MNTSSIIFIIACFFFALGSFWKAVEYFTPPEKEEPIDPDRWFKVEAEYSPRSKTLFIKPDREELQNIDGICFLGTGDHRSWSLREDDFTAGYQKRKQAKEIAKKLTDHGNQNDLKKIIKDSHPF